MWLFGIKKETKNCPTCGKDWTKDFKYEEEYIEALEAVVDAVDCIKEVINRVKDLRKDGARI